MDIKKIVEKKLSIFSKLYNEIQIFGPIEQGDFLEQKVSCMVNESCLKNNSCVNCVAIRALLENKTVRKYCEYQGEGIHMTATPIEYDGKKYIVELFEDLNDVDLQYIGVVNNDVVEKIKELNCKLMKDILTDTYNRRYLEEKMQMLIIEHLSNHKSISIALADIDYFKKVNDIYGHVTGDYVLKEFAATLKEITDGNKTYVIRYGGEEFLIIMPDLTSSEALKLVEKIRVSYESKELKFDNQKIKSTASFGIITIQENLPTSNVGVLERVIKRADENLYKAKKAGRNCAIATNYKL